MNPRLTFHVCMVTYRNRCILRVFSWWLEAYESQARECRNDNRRRTWIRYLSQPCTRFLGQMVACVILSIDTTDYLLRNNSLKIRLNYLTESLKQNCNTLKEHQGICYWYFSCLYTLYDTMYCNQARFVKLLLTLFYCGTLLHGLLSIVIVDN